MLSLDGNKKMYYLHRLVALAFIPNPESKPEVNHKDGDKLNNYVYNLEWSTESENKKHAFDNGLNKPRDLKGKNNGNSKLSKEDVLYIRNNYKPYSKEFGATVLARRFNVSTPLIHKIISGESWKSV